MAETLFEGKLSNGLKCSLLESQSFTGGSELAVQLNGEIISVISINQKRNNITECKVAKSNKLHFDINTDVSKSPVKLD